MIPGGLVSPLLILFSLPSTPLLVPSSRRVPLAGWVCAAASREAPSLITGTHPRGRRGIGLRLLLRFLLQIHIRQLPRLLFPRKPHDFVFFGGRKPGEKAVELGLIGLELFVFRSDIPPD